jgi:hypothetical protein
MRPNTRPTNKDKHPGRVDSSPGPRRSQLQKKADDGNSAEERQAREDTRKAGIRHLAEVEERTTIRLRAMLAAGAAPRGVDSEPPRNNASTRIGTGKRMRFQRFKNILIGYQELKTMAQRERSGGELQLVKTRVATYVSIFTPTEAPLS